MGTTIIEVVLPVSYPESTIFGSESILNRIGLSRELETQENEEFDAESDYRAFAASRTPNRVEKMLDLVVRTGIHESLSYAHLFRVIFDPSEGITLHFTDHIVTSTGHHLRDLYRNLKNHRVTYVCEADRCNRSAKDLK